MARKLSAEERALWDKVVATVEPLHGSHDQADAEGLSFPDERTAFRPVVKNMAPSRAAPVVPKRAPMPGTTLDGSWDRRLSRGLASPDVIVDLHGHNLSAAYALLDDRLEQAIAMDARLLLLITGKPPQGDRRPVARGAIRAAVGDWLQASRHAARIAAVRVAHPRHGGAGALYIVLRRRK